MDERGLKSERFLKRWYNAYNKKWFNNELPKNTVLFWEAISGTQATTNVELIERESTLEVIGGAFVIRMNPAIAWSPRNAKLTILHEMVHIAVFPHGWRGRGGHGKFFQDKMLELAARGAFKNLW